MTRGGGGDRAAGARGEDGTTTTTTTTTTTRAPRARALDAGAFALTASLGAWLEIAEPNQRYVNPELLWRYSYPHGENTVPTVVVPLVAFVAPCVAMACAPKKYNPNMRKDRALGGLCAAIGLTWVVTCGMKNVVGGIRPDFVDRCWPDGATRAWKSAGVPECSGDYDSVQEGRRSFPSGHTSMSFAGFVYCSLYLAAWLRVGRDDHRDAGRASWHGTWKLAVVVAPIVAATFIGLTRIRDYWHHWEDVTVGALLGTAFAVLAWIHKKPYSARSKSDDAATYELLADDDDGTAVRRNSSLLDMPSLSS